MASSKSRRRCSEGGFDIGWGSAADAPKLKTFQPRERSRAESGRTACQRFAGSSTVGPAIPHSEDGVMAKILVIHGAGMNMRGKVQVDVFEIGRASCRERV